jgi:hypothetical protein
MKRIVALRGLRPDRWIWLMLLTGAGAFTFRKRDPKRRLKKEYLGSACLRMTALLSIYFWDGFPDWPVKFSEMLFCHGINNLLERYVTTLR